MSDLTDAEALGTGLAFLTDWDVDVSPSGSIGLIDGLAVLRRDLAFALQQSLATARGERRQADLREDVRIAARDTILDDDRVDSLDALAIDFPEGSTDTIELTIAVTATTGERGEFILTI